MAARLADARPGLADRGNDPDLVALRVDVAAAWPHLSASEQETIALAASTGCLLSKRPPCWASRPRRSACGSPAPGAGLRRHLDPTTAGDPVPARTASERSPR